MATENAPASGTATAAAGAAEIDYEKLAATIGKSLETRIGALVAEATKPFQDVIAKFEAASSAPPAAATTAATDGGKPKAFTLEDVSKLLDSKLQQQAASSKQAEERKGFVAAKLKDLPPAYQNQLGPDPSKWAAEEQAIRDQYKADFKIAGGTTPKVEGGNPGGSPPAAAVDVSKLSSRAKIEAGLKMTAHPVA